MTAEIIVDPLDSGGAGASAVRGGVVRVAGFALTVLISVGSSALLLRYLGQVGAGKYGEIISLVALCGGFTDAGLSSIGVRELASRDAAGRRAFMPVLSGLRLALATAGVLGAMLFAASVGYGAMLVAGTFLAGITMILTVMQDTYAIPLTARLKISSVAAADLLRVAVLGGLIVMLVVLHAELFLFFVVGIPAGICSMGFNAWLVRRELPLLPGLRPREWRELLGDTLSFSLATGVIAVYFRVAIIIVSLVSTAHQTGIFFAAFRVIEVLLTTPPMLVGVAFPIFARAARDDHARLAYAVGRVFDALWLLGLAVAISLVVGAPFVIAVIGGHAFAGAAVVLRIQGISMVATFTGAVWSFTLLSLHRHREILIVSLSALALAIVLTLILASADGARGAAIGTTIGEFVFVSMLGAAVWRTGLRPVIGWRAVPRSLLAAALALCVLLIPGVPDLVAVLLALCIYAGGLLAMRAIPSELLALVPGRG